MLVFFLWGCGVEKRKRRHIWLWVIGSIVVVLIAFRIALPFILLRFVNREIDRLEGYDGEVKDIDVSLIRGSYIIKDIRLDKTSGKIPVPFFKANSIDASIEWRALFRGKLVGEVDVYDPVVNFVKGPTEETSQTGLEKSWVDVVDELMPLHLNRFEVFRGKVYYRDFHSSPQVDVGLTDLHILAENLSNAEDREKELPSTVSATADMYGGDVSFDMNIDPLNKKPQFDAKMELKGLQLNKVNDFLKAYGSFDVSAGIFSVYSEAAANQGRITGYTKPIIKDVKVLDWKEDKEKGKPLQPVWEAIVGGVGWLLKNKSKDQVATKAEFTGNIQGPDFDIWQIIGQLLRNAFIQALFPSLENSVSLSSLSKPDDKKQGLFQQIFGGKDEKKKKKK